MDQTEGSATKLPIINPQSSNNNVYPTIKSSSRINPILEEPEGTKVSDTARESYDEEVEKNEQSPEISMHNQSLLNEVLDAVREAQDVITNQYIPVGRNIQRIQLMINPDFFPEEKQETTSVASTRPIPTLRQIYGHVNIIDNGGYHDWITAFDTPTAVFVIDSNQASIYSEYGETSNDYTSTTSNYSTEVGTTEELTTETTTDVYESEETSTFSISGSEGLSLHMPDIEFRTRDDESGYQSMISNRNLGSDVTSDLTRRSMSLYNNEFLQVMYSNNNKLNSTISSINSEFMKVIDPNYVNINMNSINPEDNNFRSSLILNSDQCNKSVMNDLESPKSNSTNVINSISSNDQTLATTEDYDIKTNSYSNQDSTKLTISSKNELKSMTTNKNSKSNKTISSVNNDTTTEEYDIKTNSCSNKDSTKLTISSDNELKSITTNKSSKSTKTISSVNNDTSVPTSIKSSQTTTPGVTSSGTDDVHNTIKPKSPELTDSKIFYNGNLNIFHNSTKRQSKSLGNNSVLQHSNDKKIKSYCILDLKKSRKSPHSQDTCTGSKQSVTAVIQDISADTISMLSKKSTVVIRKSPKPIENETELRNSTGPNNSTGDKKRNNLSMLSKKSTVVIRKSAKPDEHEDKPRFHSSPNKATDDKKLVSTVYNPCVVHDSVSAGEHIPGSSYTDCLSEILERTTNFEAIEATIEAMEEVGAFAHSNLHRPGPPSAHSLYVQPEPWKCPSDSSVACHLDRDCHKCDSDVRLHHYWGLSDHRRGSRFPSNRFKAPRTLRRWHYYPSSRRRRWHYMCKSTQPYWTHWSSWPHALSKKYFLSHILQSSTIREDADVQTNYYICQETGTDNRLREMKSTANSVIESLQDIGPNAREQRYLGAPVFPFLYNSTVTSLPVNTLNIRPESKSVSCFGSFAKISKGESDNDLWNAAHGISVPLEERSCQYEETLPPKPEAIEEETSYTKSETPQLPTANAELATSFVRHVDIITSNAYLGVPPIKHENMDKSTSFIQFADQEINARDSEQVVPLTVDRVEKATSFKRFIDMQTSETQSLKPDGIEKEKSCTKSDTPHFQTANSELATGFVHVVDVIASKTYSEVPQIKCEDMTEEEDNRHDPDHALSLNNVHVERETSLKHFLDMQTSDIPQLPTVNAELATSSVELVDVITSNAYSDTLQLPTVSAELATSYVQLVDVITSDAYSANPPIKPEIMDEATSFIQAVDKETSPQDSEQALPPDTVHIETATSFKRFVDIQTSETLSPETEGIEEETSYTKSDIPQLPTANAELATSFVHHVDVITSHAFTGIPRFEHDNTDEATSFMQLVDQETNPRDSEQTQPLNTVHVERATSFKRFIDFQTSDIVPCIPDSDEKSTSLLFLKLDKAPEIAVNSVCIETSLTHVCDRKTSGIPEILPECVEIGISVADYCNDELSDYIETDPESERKLRKTQKDEDFVTNDKVNITNSDTAKQPANQPTIEQGTNSIRFVDVQLSCVLDFSCTPADDKCSSCCSCIYNCGNKVANEKLEANDLYTDLSHGKFPGEKLYKTVMKAATIQTSNINSDLSPKISLDAENNMTANPVTIQASNISSELDIMSFNYVGTNTPASNKPCMETKTVGMDLRENGTQLYMPFAPIIAWKSRCCNTENVKLDEHNYSEHNETQKSRPSETGLKLSMMKTPTNFAKIEKKSSCRSENSESGSQTTARDLCYYSSSSTPAKEQRIMPMTDRGAVERVYKILEARDQKQPLHSSKLTRTEPNINSISSDEMGDKTIGNRVTITEQKSAFTSTSVYGKYQDRTNKDTDSVISTASKFVSAMDPFPEEENERPGKEATIVCGISTSVTDLASSSDSVSTCTRSTSVLGLNTILEAEILLSSLLKKALIDVDTQASRFMEFRESSKTYPAFATKSTYTCVGLESKSIWVNPSKVTKLCVDTYVQAEDSADRFFEIKDAPHHSTVSSMTSQYGQAEAVQTVLIEKESEKVGQNICSCVAPSCQDCHTNTDACISSDPLTSILQLQKSVEVSSNAFNNSMTSKSQLKNNINNQLLSLSRLLGTSRRKTSSFIDHYGTPTAVLSSNLDADKWMRACTSMQKDAYAYQSFLRPEKEFEGSTFPVKSSTSAIFNILGEKLSHAVPSEMKNLVIKDSLADVLPPPLEPKKKSVHNNLAELLCRTVMVDAVTSDQFLSKNKHEFEHQAVPTVHEVGIGTNTESITQNKSASVVTSKCILPTCTACNYFLNCGKEPKTPCKFVYGEPTCVVHKQSSNVEVQTLGTPRVGMVQAETLVERSDVGVLTPFFGMLPVQDHFNMKKSSLIGTVLSPKVYKALYDTTKILVQEDAQEEPERDCSSVPERQSPKKPRSPNASANADINEHTVHLKKTAIDTIVQTSSNLLRTKIINIPLEGKATGDFIKIYKRDSRKTVIQQSNKPSPCEFINVLKLKGSKFENLEKQLKSQKLGEKESPTKESSLTRKEKVKEPASVQESKTPSCKEDTRKQITQDAIGLDATSLKEDESDEGLKANLVTSYRYYNTLLKQLGKVKDNLTKHLTMSPVEVTVRGPQDPLLSICTMKPSGRENLACQTVKRSGQQNERSHLCVLSPATCLTDICKNDKDHLKSVYTILSAIEGRMRRLNIESPKTLSREDRWQ